jgi:O-antigen ligase
LGGFLVIVFGLALYQLLRFEQGKMYFRPWKLWAAHLSTVLFLWSSILITFSRAAIVSTVFLLAGWLVYGYLVNEKNLIRSLSRIGLYCLLLFVIFNGMTHGIWMQRFGVVLSSEANQEQERLENISTDERIISYHQSAALARPAHLIKGVGLGGFVPTLTRAFPDLDIYQYQPTHNAFVLMILEIGIIGAALYLWFFLSLVKDTWRERRSNVYSQYLFSLIALLAFMGFFDHFLWTQNLGQSLWWLVVGIAANRGK